LPALPSQAALAGSSRSGTQAGVERQGADMPAGLTRFPFRPLPVTVRRPEAKPGAGVGDPEVTRGESSPASFQAASGQAASGQAEGVFVVGPPAHLDPARFGDQTACVGGEDVLLGRAIFGSSMIVPADGRATALATGMCQVILVTLRGEAEAARRSLADMGVAADARQQ
jgi:hypothetical protein